MRAFAETYPVEQFVQEVLAQITWYHNILCKSKNKVIVEYALRDTRKPIGVSGYKLTELLPKRLKGNLPTIEEIEAELGNIDKPYGVEL